MINIQVIDYISVIAFWLSFSRWVTIMFQFPVFDNVAIPAMSKILFSIVLTYAFFPFVKASVIQDVVYMGTDNFWLLTLFYTISGLLIGHLAKIITNIFTSAGSVISMQIGFGATRYFDPSVGQQVGPLDKLIYWTVLMMILYSGALIPLFKGAYQSFFSINIMTVSSVAKGSLFYFEFFKSIFVASVLLATPMLFSAFLINVVMGIVTRTIPQMNVLMVSLVVNIGIGLIVFITISHEFFQMAFRIYSDRLGEWFQFII